MRMKEVGGFRLLKPTSIHKTHSQKVFHEKSKSFIQQNFGPRSAKIGSSSACEGARAQQEQPQGQKLLQHKKMYGNDIQKQKSTI